MNHGTVVLTRIPRRPQGGVVEDDALAGVRHEGTEFGGSLEWVSDGAECAEDERSESEGRFGEAEPKGSQASAQVV